MNDIVEVREIHNIEELAEYWYGYVGDDPESAIKSAVYKYTDCGAWAKTFPAYERWDGVLVKAGISFGSIVEGVDECTQVYTVYFPCLSSELSCALDNVEKEAEEIWMKTHGCKFCWNGEVVFDGWGGEIGPDDYGMRPVDPDCPACGGQGVVI